MAFFYVVLSIIIVLFAPVFLGANVYFDLSKGKSIVDVKLFGINLFKLYVYEKQGEFFIKIGKNEEKKLKSSNKNGFPFFKAVKIRKIRIVMRLGLNDAATTALLTAALNNATYKNVEVICLPDYENGATVHAEIRALTLPVIGVLYGFRKA